MKTRFDGLDVMAMVCHLQRTLLGSKVVNIYNDVHGASGGDSDDTYVLKLDNNANANQSNNGNKKCFLLLQSGIRFHDVVVSSEEQGDDDANTNGNNGSASAFTSSMLDFSGTMPTPFCSKLRKHLRGLRLEHIQQVGNDRVVVFKFQGHAASYALVLELYAKGNLLLCDGANNYTILALLRSHVYETNDGENGSKKDGSTAFASNGSNNPSIDEAKATNDENQDKVLVKVGKVYPVTYATTQTSSSSNDNDMKEEVTLEDKGILSSDFQTWVREQCEGAADPTATSNVGKKKNKTGKGKSKPITLKTLILRPSSGVSQYGPALLEHCICMANLPPHAALVVDGKDDGKDDENERNVKLEINGEHDVINNKGFFAGYAIDDWQRLRTLLREEAPAVLGRLSLATKAETPGYLFYKPMPKTENNNTDNDKLHSALPYPDKLLTEFQPHLLKQHESLPYVQTRHFGQAVSEFFVQLSAQKQQQKVWQAEQQAVQKRDKIQQDQEDRMRQLEQEILLQQQQAMAVQQHATKVDQALTVVNSAVDSGMDWEQLLDVIRVEKEHENPVAILIQELKLEDNLMILNLPFENYDASTPGDEDDDPANTINNEDGNFAPKINTLSVPIRLEETAHGNASLLFAQYRAAKEKSQKTLQSLSKAMDAAKAMAERQLKQATAQRKITLPTGAKKTLWFEKFHWMITTDNYLVLAGKDAHQNELLVKRYLRVGDAYLHADVHGAASCILRAKRSKQVQQNKGKARTVPLPLSDQALREAGHFTICHSSAWASRMVTSAWWVHSHQVSKTAPSGEFLTVGSFMVRGKKNFLPPAPLEMGLAVLFRLGNDASIARHRNKDRRDFMLLTTTEDESVANDNGKKTAYGIQSEMANDNSQEKSKTFQEQMMPVDDPGDDMDDPAQDTAVAETDDKVDPKIENDSLASQREDGNGANISQKTNRADDLPEFQEVEEDSCTAEDGPKKKKGLSARDRKLIKKYGSLEEAERILAGQENDTQRCKDGKVARDDESISLATTSAMETKRGKKSKLKRQKKKYADQDEEDRELALLLLQGGGGKKERNQGQKEVISSESQSKVEAQVEAETAAVLTKDSAIVASKLPEAVRIKLSQCLENDNNDGNTTGEVHWDKIDGDVLEQLVVLEPEEAQLAAVTRLLSFTQGKTADNYNTSLAGILRTIRKYGYQNLNDESKRVKKDSVIGSNGDKKSALDDVDEPEVDFDDEADIDDTAELDKLTGKPLPQDLLLHAVPVCAPYSTLSQYHFRVKLTPGNLKRGKASKQCVELILQQLQTSNKAASGDATNQVYRELIKHVSDNDWVQAMISDVKLSAAGSGKLVKKQQQKAKSGKSKK